MRDSSEPLGAPKRHVLLVLTGRSPQVVTETLYAFNKHRGVQFDQLVVVTMPDGRREVLKHLIGQGQTGKLQRLVEDFSLRPIQFSAEDIHLITDAQGNVITDARSGAQLAAVANFMLNMIRDITRDDNTVLHASLAGGRKTLAFYLGYAMSLFARGTDSLNHVFVENQFESSEFFYPTPYPSPIYTLHGTVDAADANVELATIPLIRQREGLPKDLLRGETSFEECVAICNTIHDPVELIVDTEHRELCCSGLSVKLTKANFAFYLMMLEEMLDENEGYPCPALGQADRVLAIDYLHARLRIEGVQQRYNSLAELTEVALNTLDGIKESEIEGLKNGMKASFFNARKNEIRNAFASRLPRAVAEHYDIDILTRFKRSDATRLAARFGIKLPPECVTIKEFQTLTSAY